MRKNSSSRSLLTASFVSGLRVKEPCRKSRLLFATILGLDQNQGHLSRYSPLETTPRRPLAFLRVDWPELCVCARALVATPGSSDPEL